MPFVITTPTPTDTEDLTLDGLVLNSGILGLSEVDLSPPRERQEWIGGADSESPALMRKPKHQERTITATINVIPSGDMDAALDSIGAVRDKFASIEAPDTIPLTWSPATSTRTTTFNVMSGEIVGLPVNWENGWLAKAPSFTIEMKAEPYGEVEEILLATVSSNSPIVTAEITNSGDVEAKARLIVTDTASQSRRHVEWGLEGPSTYNPATLLLLDSDSLVTSGFAGSQAVAGPTGAYDPNASGNNVILGALQPQPTAVCGTGNQSHVGSFRVKARVYFGNVPATIRFSWRAGDGPMTANAWTTVSQGTAWLELDLGTVTVPQAELGAQRWTGQIEASATTATNMLVDFLILVPVSAGYGKARATYSYQSGVLTGFDAFTGTAAGGALNARVAPAGGTWATSGATTDFAFADDLSGEQIKRSTASDASPRFAILGASNFADTQVDVLIRHDSTVGTTAQASRLGVIARWVDSSNYLYGALYRGLSFKNLLIVEVVAGVSTTLANLTLPTATTAGTFYGLRMLVFASGRTILQLLDATKSKVIAATEGQSSSLVSGGALDDGKPGIYDQNTIASAAVRYYDDFSVATPAPEPIALYSGQSIEFRHNDTIREDATGVYAGRPQSYRGSRFLVPVGTSRVLVKARRNDVDVATNDNVTDATQVQVALISRVLVVPRG